MSIKDLVFHLNSFLFAFVLKEMFIKRDGLPLIEK